MRIDKRWADQIATGVDDLTGLSIGQIVDGGDPLTCYANVRTRAICERPPP